MARFRKKPVVIEAHQWSGSNAADLLHWIGESAAQDGATLVIHTLEGDHEASLGDWIIKGVAGEFYACKPDIFAATYERVAECIFDEIAAERRRQIEVEGWTPEHDAQHTGGELLTAAQCYRVNAVAFADITPLPDDYSASYPPPAWPWDRKWWKPRNPRRDLIRAGALALAEIDLGRIATQAWAEHDLIVAEIERLDRREEG